VTPSAEPAEELSAHILDPDVPPARIAELLDGLAAPVRREVVRGLGRRPQARLYEKVEGFAPVRLTELVPPDRAALEPVRHYGRNTLPAFTLFEKRFCRGSDVDAAAPRELLGFNHQPMAALTGPGYFVAVEDPQRAEVLVDYRRVPTERPAAWPPVRSNERGLSRFVYGFMVDTLRRVSRHVTIGSAARRGRDLGSWFVLCSELSDSGERL